MTQLTLKGFETYETNIINFPFQGRPIPLPKNDSKQDSDILTVNKPIIDKAYTETPHHESNPVDAYTPAEIQIMLKYLWNTPSRYKGTNIRNYLYIALSVNTSRRAGDILSLQVCDVLTENGEIRSHIYMKESKTDKKTRTPINLPCQKALAKYFNTKRVYTMSEYLFPKYNKPEPNTTEGMRIMLQRLAEKLVDLHLEYIEQGLFAKHYGTHSLRKTMPRHIYETSTNQKDINTTSQYLAHSGMEVTKRYLNIRQEDIDDLVNRFAIDIED